MPVDITVLVPIVALLFAGLIVALLWLWWSGTRDKEEQGTEPQPITDVSEETLPSSPQVAVESGDVIEVIRVLRDLSNGSLIVEINGRRYRSLDEISDAEVGRRFLGNAKAVAQFARLDTADVPEIEEPTPAPPPVEPEYKTVPTPPPAAAPPQQSTQKSGGFLRRGSKDEESEEPVPEPLSIAEQVDELLQERLISSSTLAQRSIQIRPTLDGGLRIVVDEVSFENVDDVTDDEVKLFIQETIQMWEARQ